MKKYKTSIFIFRRDLRLEDNTGLIKALKMSDVVIPIFIINPHQVGKKNEYRGDHSLQVLSESLVDLHNQLKEKKSQLYLFYGKIKDVFEFIKKEVDLDAVFVNEDYTPFSKKRDEFLKTLCEKNDVDFYSIFDLLLTQPGSVLKNDGNPYTIYSYFYKKAIEQEVSLPQKNNYKNYFSKNISESLFEENIKKIVYKKNEYLALTISRESALKQLQNISTVQNYKECRDFPIENCTSYLSTFHKFGNISIRETYDFIQSRFGKDSQFIKELYWRDFFSHIAHFFPHVFGNAFNKKYNALPWISDEELFQKWCEGKTGFPIVDAGMRELNETGYMHNRVRMIVASFLVKDLHIDWKRGEKYFAQKLIDYDPAVNNGNWQWAASTGCDAQPYFRVFNPWRQQERFDPECLYIKKWIPELKNLDTKIIKKWETKYSEYENVYFAPIVNHKEQSQKIKEIFKEIV